MADYKNTINLPQTGFPMKADLAQREPAQLARWEAVRREFVGKLRLPWGTESAAVLKAVAAHRAYWRPKEVRLLVLSESHVWTREVELAAAVNRGPASHFHRSARHRFIWKAGRIPRTSPQNRECAGVTLSSVGGLPLPPSVPGP